MHKIPEILSVRETAEYLGLCRDTVESWLRRKEIPGAKIGGRWKIYKSLLDERMNQKKYLRRKNDTVHETR